MSEKRRLHRVALRAVAAADRRHVAVEEARADDLVDDALVESRRVQIGRLLRLDELREDAVASRAPRGEKSSAELAR